MPGGTQVFNKSRTLQLTNNDLPYVLLKSMRITSTAQWNNQDQISSLSNPKFTLPQNIQIYSDIIFFIRANGFDARCTVDPYGGVFKWHDLVLQPGQYIDIYAFSRFRPTIQSTRGMQLFYPGKGLVFDGSWYLLNIEKVYTIPAYKPDYSANGGVTTYNIATEYTDANYAVGLSTFKQIHHKFSGAGGLLSTQLQNCVWMQGNTIKVNYVPLYSDVTGGWTGIIGFAQSSATYAYVINTTNLPLPYSIN
ncbi:hypothetical protein BIY26_09565 [Brenneria goodwinii]|uniref:Uncharacterized protein n=1 Tax=Brenneria goodwinii TaxID=1109412 RepID=A0A250BBE5_9GAMM|nr:hypothetical protein [Brenneria goodwinii]ATA22634.1 hypothetical protein AWC36_00050 [Brenneria goodwinii]ATA23548.1 hypothetical protein AWC36_05190 [Brenneria goodwinii]RLM25256.1 hypothetical protein BIY26_09565 [Brenneria goodwinii]